MGEETGEQISHSQSIREPSFFNALVSERRTKSGLWLRQLDDETVEEGWQSMIRRVNQETGYLKLFEEMGVNLGNLTLEGKVKMPILINYKGRKPYPQAAEYDRGRINVYAEAIDVRRIWFVLAGVGELHEQIWSLLHELGHHYQTGKVERFLGLTGPPVAVQEVQAHLLSTPYDPNEEKYLEAVRKGVLGSLRIVYSTPGYQKIDWERIERPDLIPELIQRARRLRTLGVSFPETTKILRRFRFYGKNPFGEIDHHVNQLKIGRRVRSEEEMHRAILDHERKMEEERLKAWNIAYEELEKLAGGKQATP